MAFPTEYHIAVRSSISASILFASLVLAPAAFVSPSQAQINGAPPSVTSPGFGGRPINGTPPSVTSLGPRGFTPGPSVRFPIAPRPFRNGSEHRRHRDNTYAFPLIYAVPVPYAVDSNVVDDSGEDDPDDQGGPTVFDRRGSGAGSYISGVRDVPPAHSSEAVLDPPSDPAPAQESTFLVFKDGRQLEVGNYAIVGATLIDLTPGHSRKIAIADLDLDATRKQNENRGVIFQLPPSLQSN
jgi:hypothetical protein